MPSNIIHPLLSVRDAAGRLRVTPRTLKYYEERGLVTPSRSEGRYRLYDEQDIEQFARILRLRSLGFSLHGITEMLKRPLEPAGGERRRYSRESLQQIGAALAQQIEALDERIASVRHELKEAGKVRAQLHGDLDYVQRRLAGENADQLLDERRAARRLRARENDARQETGQQVEQQETAQRTKQQTNAQTKRQPEQPANPPAKRQTSAQTKQPAAPQTGQKARQKTARATARRANASGSSSNGKPA